MVHEVDFICCDFNTNAFSTIDDVFLGRRSSQNPSDHHLWSIGDDSYKDCTGFLTMPRRPFTWRVQAHGCYPLDNADHGFAPSDLTAHLPCLSSPCHQPSWSQQCRTQRPGPDPSERAASKHERKRLRKRLALPSTPRASSTQPPDQYCLGGTPRHPTANKYRPGGKPS